MRIQLALRNRMFFFFSVVFPLGMFFLYAGIFAKGNPRVVSFYLGPVIALNVMGSFWGLSAMLVMFREQGILRRFHVNSGQRHRHARLQHSRQLFAYAAHRAHRIAFSLASFSM